MGETEITCGVYIHNPKGEILICHANEMSRNIWGIPKGRPDVGEMLKDAAIREVREETGIDLFWYEDVMSYVGIEKYGKKNKTLVAWTVKLNECINDLRCESLFVSLRSENKIPEIDEYKWVNFHEYKHRINRTAVRLWERYLATQNISSI